MSWLFQILPFIEQAALILPFVEQESLYRLLS
jgi:hypothetical protein